MKRRNQSICPFYMLSLMLQQRIVRLAVEPLDKPHVHVPRIVQRMADLCQHEGRSKSEALCFRKIVHRAYVERARLGRKLLDLDVWNLLKDIARDGLFSQPLEMVEKVSIVLSRRLFRLPL